MKILEVIDGLGWCGTKEQTYLNTLHLSKYFEVHLALAFGHKEMIERLKGKVELKFYEVDNGSKRRFNIKNYLRLYQIVKEGNYHILIANSSWSLNYVIAILPFLKKKPKIIALRRSGFTPSFLSKHLKYRFVDKIVVVSKKVAQQLIDAGFFPEKIAVIESGIDLSRFKPSEEYREEYRRKLGLEKDHKVFVNVANWQPWRKGQDVLLEVFSHIVKKYKNLRLILVGKDTDSKQAMETIRRFNLESFVIPLGYREDVEKILQASDYFILTSRSEGIAGSLLQAMACGKVVLSTLAGGIGEYLIDGFNGFSAQIDNKGEIMKKIERMINISKEEYSRLSENAINTAKNYSIETNIKKWVELIGTLTQSANLQKI
ncbi:glycosyltransferase family 4 protein [Thermocrinis sp.]